VRPTIRLLPAQDQRIPVVRSQESARFGGGVPTPPILSCCGTCYSTFDFYDFAYSFRLHEARGYTQPLTGMSARERNKNVFGSRTSPVGETHSLTAHCEPIVDNV
jgi:hypothetical protein